MVGFPKPILHGLCTYGYACRALLKSFADNDTTKLKSLRVRFANPVLPGDTLVTEMWREGGSVIFQTKVKSSGQVVLTNAAATFAVTPAICPGPPSVTNATSKLKSAPVFDTMSKIITGNPAMLKKNQGCLPV